jgi:hypothetical protein
VGTGQWDPMSAGTPGRGRFLASDADRERAIDLLKTAFVHGTLTKTDLDVRAGRVLTARTYADLAALTSGLTPAPATATATATATAKPRPPARPARRKVVAWSATGVLAPAALAAAFLTPYGGFLVIMAFTFVVTVLLSKPPARPRPDTQPLGGRH